MARNQAETWAQLRGNPSQERFTSSSNFPFSCFSMGVTREIQQPRRESRYIPSLRCVSSQAGGETIHGHLIEILERVSKEIWKD